MFGACDSNKGCWLSWWDLSFVSSCVAALLCHAQEESVLSYLEVKSMVLISGKKCYR